MFHFAISPVALAVVDFNDLPEHSEWVVVVALSKAFGNPSL